ncbi:MAG: hypothetical protein DWQ02_22035 [Bacteroidetes bacterium]|nr:MAG: hypothetical protein DWQ02_22035 [Bacteroidota bacterium]
MDNYKKYLLYLVLIMTSLACDKDPDNTIPPEEVTCETTLTDIDGNTYLVVKIGDQCWMAENLRTTHYADGTPISLGEPGMSLWEDYTSKYYFNYDSLHLEEFGALFELLLAKSKLYTWAAATNLEGDGSANGIVQGVCPDGWHLPNKSDWEELINFVGIETAGQSLKSDNPVYWNNDIPDMEGTDEYGFNSIASGGRDSFGAWYIFDLYAFYWSSSTFEDESWRVWTPFLVNYSKEVQWLGYSKSNSFCVRCVKNK